MNGELAGKVALITGGGSGIGQGLVLGFLREGARVVLADIDREKAATTLAQARSEGFGEQLLLLTCDVTLERDVAAAVDAAVTTFGGIDCMVNNAGGPGAMEPLLDMSVERFDASLALLLRSVFLGIKHAGAAMVRRGQGGSIVSTASIAARMGGCSPSVYAAAKAAVVQLSAMAAVELAPHRIRVNSISPGAIHTEGFAAGGISRERLALEQPWPSAGLPADVAAAAIFLASDRCHYATGSDFVIDGGLVAQGPMLLRRLYGSPHPGTD